MTLAINPTELDELFDLDIDTPALAALKSVWQLRPDQAPVPTPMMR